MADFKIETYKKLQDKIMFSGVQKDHNGKDYGYMFTDRLTGSSFLIKNDTANYEQTILDRLEKIRKMFETADGGTK